eukprot:12980174-Ditylum_brightwellii.AAC.1
MKVTYINRMKINHKSLEVANCNQGNKPLPILFYVHGNKKKLSPSDYQTYKLHTNPKDEKSAVYNLVVKYYEVGTPEEWLQFIDAIAQVIKGQGIQDGVAVYLLVKSLLKGDILQVFKNKETSQDIKDSPAFTKCLAAVMEHIFPKKAYKTQKKHIWNIHKPLVLGPCEWILQMIKLNNYLEFFLVLDRVTATKIAREEIVDVLEDGVLYQWKLDFKKEGFDLSSSTLKEFLD